MVGICGPSAVVLLCCRKDFTNYSPKLQSSRPAFFFFFLQSGENGGREKRRRGTKKERVGEKKKSVKGKREKERECKGCISKFLQQLDGGGAGPM